eukprot:CFRG4266T1
MKYPQSLERVQGVVNEFASPNIVSGSLGWAAGAVTFPSFLFLSQKYVLLPLRVSTAVRSVASVMGFVAVFVGGSASSLVAIETRDQILQTFDKETASITSLYKKHIPEATIVCGLVSAAMFHILGGRFISVCPSNISYRGAFARFEHSLPATGPKYATATQRKITNELGRKFGCHTCGIKGNYIVYHADHQPPNATKWWWQKQRFYAQCKSCSSCQVEECLDLV